MLCGRLSRRQCGKSLIVNRYPLIVGVGTECEVFHTRVKCIIQMACVDCFAASLLATAGKAEIPSTRGKATARRNAESKNISTTNLFEVLSMVLRRKDAGLHRG